jgi:lipopolysaccharide export system ATP-binding protein
MGIVCKDLIKKYGRREVVRGVSLAVHPGEVVGLLGPNGAGKTTTFYMIVGLEAAHGGSIHLGEQEITRLPMHRRARLGIGYLAQEPSIFRKLSVEENILAVLELTGLARFCLTYRGCQILRTAVLRLACFCDHKVTGAKSQDDCKYAYDNK